MLIESFVFSRTGILIRFVRKVDGEKKKTQQGSIRWHCSEAECVYFQCTCACITIQIKTFVIVTSQKGENVNCYCYSILNLRIHHLWKESE